MDLIPANPINEQDWNSSIIQILIQPSSIVVEKDLKDFIVTKDRLYFRCSAGVLARALSLIEVRENFQCIYSLS